MNNVVIVLVCAFVAVVVCGPFPESHPDDMMYPGQGRHRMGGPGGPDAPYGPSGPGGFNQVGRPSHYVEPKLDPINDMYSCTFALGNGIPAMEVTSMDTTGKRRMLHGICYQCGLCTEDGMECHEIHQVMCM